jgi:hypothetical protein
MEREASVVFLKFVEEVQTMVAAEVELKSPLFRPFQRGILFRELLTPLWKRGEGGDFWMEYGGSHAANFWVRILALD